ncbi:amine oxidase, flavin containing [Legionella steigerwaltii]|uniref:Amine oxidase, flavin containing n=1 Tax=Legionella steigerwaltii TaxID=460 RepID=A0A378L5B5_9GAMM|nr:FAD-dependent oxidoreductase [Legionella steigerwaltii]KTD77228.1 amine oxidase, flavin containing [Legionella steigerwaltii]STY21954.1 amine oxidase, flavin containing [Legionella steigerwaltii]
MPNILVIGGGTGLTTAYMLENVMGFNITLAEKSERYGGHINSLNFGDHGIAEGGAEFIGAPESYPNVHKLFSMLGVKLKRFELNADLHKVSIEHGKDDHLVLPPVYHSAEKNNHSLSDFFGCFFTDHNASQKEIRIDFGTLLNKFSDLLTLEWEILRAQHEREPENINEVQTLEEFMEGFKKKNPGFKEEDIDNFSNRVLYPIVGAAWGIPISEAKKFCAFYAMNYLALSKDWYDAPSGLSSYMDAMKAQCKNLDMRLNTEVTKLIPITDSESTKYQAMLSDGTLMQTEKGIPLLFDDVVISTPAYASAAILPDIDTQDMQELKEALKKVRYYDTTLAFHLDPNYAPPRGTVVHTRVEGDLAANTAQKDWKAKNGATPVKKTWVLPGQPMPNNILKTEHYKHPIMDKNYFIAQQKLHTMQKKYGLYFGGILGWKGDSHEDGTIAALQAARSIHLKHHRAPTANRRLQNFLDESGYVIERNNQLSAHEENKTCTLS